MLIFYEAFMPPERRPKLSETYTNLRRQAIEHMVSQTH